MVDGAMDGVRMMVDGGLERVVIDDGGLKMHEIFDEGLKWIFTVFNNGF